MFATPTNPNLADFVVFLNTSVQIPVVALPVNSPWPGYAFTQAMALVPCYAGVPGIMYSLAVYNCATALLFLITPDQVGQTYFTSARSNAAPQGGQPGGFALIQPSAGLVASTSDETTSTTLANPDWVKGLTIGQLQFAKTPWGREYLSFIQSYGPTIWGLT
jgi:hypothetical protein